MAQKLTWIRPRIRWSSRVDLVACIASPADQDLVDIIAAGMIRVDVQEKRLASAMAALLRDFRGVTGDCIEIASRLWPDQKGLKVTLYLHEIYQLHDENILVVLGKNPAERTEAYQKRRRAAIRGAWAARKKTRAAKKAIQDHDDGIRNHPNLSDSYKERILKLPDPLEQFFGNFLDLDLDLELVAFVPRLPRSEVLVAGSISNAAQISGKAPPRDGTYDATPVSTRKGANGAFVQWAPRGRYTPALELKAALEGIRPGFLSRSRISGFIPPDLVSVDMRPSTRVDLDAHADDLSALREIDTSSSIRGKDLFKSHSFEALAWYQPFHSYDESHWGICFDATRLDAVVAGMAIDFRKLSSAPLELAARLLIRLTVEHELFHARVEFAASWLELSARRRCYTTYTEHVYKALRGTPDWLEEALANWCSYHWLENELPNWQHASIIKDPAGIQEVIRDWLDFSPDGYRHWRLGNEHSSWQRLTTEVNTGKPVALGPRRPPLPLESLLRSQQSIELLPADVPIFILGRGMIGDALFSTPSRREILSVLARYKYIPLTDRGRGSHEFWRGPDGRGFPVPVRDPVSREVFHSLLRHFGWSKKQYLNEVRPNL